jgi:uncharacterized protein (TIGR02246 family)
MSADITKEIFACVDRRDAKGFAGFFASNGRFVFGNADPIVGREAIADAVDAFFAGLRGLRHQTLNRWDGPAGTVVEAAVEYVRPDGRTVAVPAVSIFACDDTGLVADYRIFVDLAPLFAP